VARIYGMVAPVDEEDTTGKDESSQNGNSFLYKTSSQGVICFLSLF